MYEFCCCSNIVIKIPFTFSPCGCLRSVFETRKSLSINKLHRKSGTLKKIQTQPSNLSHKQSLCFCAVIFLPVAYYTPEFQIMGTLIVKWVKAASKERWKTRCKFISKEGGHEFWMLKGIYRFCEKASEHGSLTPFLKWSMIWIKKVEPEMLHRSFKTLQGVWCDAW